MFRIFLQTWLQFSVRLRTGMSSIRQLYLSPRTGNASGTLLTAGSTFSTKSNMVFIKYPRESESGGGVIYCQPEPFVIKKNILPEN